MTMQDSQSNQKTLSNGDLPVQPRTRPAEELAQQASPAMELGHSSGVRKRLEKTTKAILSDAAGVEDANLALLFVTQIAAMQPGVSEDHLQPLVQATSLLREMKPQGATETMLAVQMCGVHMAAVNFLREATREGQTNDGSEANVLRAARLMRIFNEQIETMAKLKGTARHQKVTVEHVHVHSGGQAVVGVIEPSKGEEVNRKS